MNENRTLKKALKIIIITAVILFVLPAILLRSCYYILRDPVKVTEKYLDYQSYDTHLVALKRTEEIGRYNYKSGYSRIRDCHWRYRQVVGESVDIMVYLHNGKTVNPQHYVLQNPKYYSDIRKEWTINSAQLIGDCYYMQHKDSDRIEYDLLSDLGSALCENKINTFETTTSAVILEQIYDLINGSYDVDDHSLGEITSLGPIETFHIVLTFSQSENVAWTTTIGIYRSRDVSYKYAYIIDVGRGEPHNIGEDYTGEGEIQFVSIPKESELYDWISQVYQSQAYIDYCTLENLSKQ